MVVHSGEKSFQCELCLKKFNQNSNLIKHSKIHEKEIYKTEIILSEKEFKCNYEDCNSQYTSKASLQRHFLTHSKVIESVIVHKPPVLNPGNGVGNYVLSVRALDLPCPTLAYMMVKCLHSGCTFHSTNTNDLRAHLFRHAPGLLQEFKKMREIMSNLIHLLESWNIIAENKRVSIIY